MDDRIFMKILEIAKINKNSLTQAERIIVRESAEVGKIQLSSLQETTIFFTINSNRIEIKLTRQHLEDALRGEFTSNNEESNNEESNNEDLFDIIDECRSQTRAAIKGASWNAESIDEVLLIGGPSLMPCILEMLEEIFYSNPKVLDRLQKMSAGTLLINPMEAVARGAALSAMTKKVVPHPYGYGFVDAIVDDDHNTHYAQILIPRDTIYPVQSKPFVIQWVMRKATTEIELIQHIPQNEIRNDEPYRSLGRIDIALKCPGLSPIEIKMGLTENEELLINLKEIFSGEEVTYIGIAHLNRIPIHLPRIITKPPLHDQPKMSFNEDALKELYEWSKGFLRLAKQCPIDGQLKEIQRDVKFLIQRLEETFEDYVYDQNQNLDIGKMKMHWYKVYNNSITLLHRLRGLDLISHDIGLNFEQKGKEISDRIYKITR